MTLKKIKYIILHIFYLLILLFTPLTYAVEVGDISNHATKTPGITTVTQGYDLSGKINYSKVLIKGALPFVMTYDAALKDDNQSGINMYDEILDHGVADWSNNYYGVILVDNAQTIYSIQLPGSSERFIFFKINDELRRYYYSGGSSSGLSDIFYTAAQTDVNIQRNGMVITIIKDGVKYIAESYTGFGGYSGGGSTTDYRYKFTKIVAPNGTIISLDYDSNQNLKKISDNRNNSITFERTYKNGLVQTLLESRLITATVYKSGNDEQRASINYIQEEVPDVLNPPAKQIRYKISSMTSQVSGTESFQYQNWFRPSLMKFMQKQVSRTLNLEEAVYPTLVSYSNANGVKQREWSYNPTYTFWRSSVRDYFAPASLVLTSYSTVNNQKVNHTHSEWVDITGDAASIVYINGIAQIVRGSVKAYPSLPSNYNGSDLNLMRSLTANINISESGTIPFAYVGDVPIKSYRFNPFINRMTAYTDLNDIVTAYTYDEFSRIATIRQAYGTKYERITSYIYGKLSDDSVNYFNVPTSITAPNLNITNVVSPRGQITEQIISSPQGGSSTKTLRYEYYDTENQSNYGLLKVAYGYRDGMRVGSVSSFIDRTEYTYDNWGNIASKKSYITNMHSGVTTPTITQYADYNSAGLPGQKTDPDGKVTNYKYNNAFQLTEENYASLAITSKSYDELNQLKTETDADGKVISYDYDAIGRLIKTTRSSGSYTSYSYHSNGVISAKQERDANGTVVEELNNQLDNNGRITKTWKGANSSQYVYNYTYDNNGNMKTQTNANGLTERWEYDALNRMTDHTNGDGRVEHRDYDISDNNTRIIDFNGNINNYEYKNSNVLMHDISSEFPVKRYWHDVADNVEKKLYGNRACHNTDYDQLNRVRYDDCFDETGVTNHELRSKTFYAWDILNNRLNSVVDETNSSFNDKGVNTFYYYDALGRIKEKRQLNKTPKQWGYPTLEQTVKYTYSASNRPISITYPSGNVVSFGYFANGLLDNITLNGNKNILCNISWDGAVRLRGWAWGCVDSSRYSMNIGSSGAINGLSNTIDGQVLFQESYNRDNAGRIIRKVLNGNHIVGYGYDNVDRLQFECHSQDSNGSCGIGIGYTYDDNGNRRSKTYNSNNGAVLPQNESYTHSRNVLASWKIGNNNINLSHTLNAELVDGRIGTPLYDYAGRRKLESNVPGSNKYTGIWNEYNHKNERTFRGGSYIDRQYVYDENSHLIGEYTAAGTMIVEYVWLEDKPVAAIYPNNQMYWIFTDYQNKPRRLVDSNTKQVVWTWDSDAFGAWQPVGSVEMNLRFPGQYYDEQSGLYYNHNRYYNPELGRYMEPDPIGLEGGLNPYIYANGNPIGNVDPSGLYAYVNSRGEWVENGQNFYSASGGAFTDKIAYNFAIDVATMAPLPSFNLFPKGTLFFETTTAASTLVDKSTSLFNASESAYRASVNIKNWLPKDKHMINSTAKKSAKFDTNDPLIVKDRVIEALRSPNATFLPNGSSSNSYQIITDMNRVIGTKGQTSLKVVVDKNGNIWTAYPVK